MRKRLVFVVAGVVAAAAAVAVFAGGGDIFGDPPRPPDDASLPPAPTLPPGGDCPYGPIGFQGRIACIPPGASAGGSPLNEYPPDLPSGTLLPPEYSLIRRGGSFITYTTGQVLEWNVAPGDEADFVPLRDVFGIPEGVPFIPPPGPLVGDACPYGAIAFRGVVSCLPQRTEHSFAVSSAACRRGRSTFSLRCKTPLRFLRTLGRQSIPYSAEAPWSGIATRTASWSGMSRRRTRRTSLRCATCCTGREAVAAAGPGVGSGADACDIVRPRECRRRSLQLPGGTGGLAGISLRSEHMGYVAVDRRWWSHWLVL